MRKFVGMIDRRTMLRRTATAAALLPVARFLEGSIPAAETPASSVARARQGMVATVHPLATDAGVAAMKRGGNAVDAAIAAALTLSVVDQHNSGLGGGCFILLRRGDGKFAAIDGRETAPAKTTRDMFVVDGKPRPDLSQAGPLAVATPGALAAYEMALREHGKLKLADLLLPAAEIAEAGFAIDKVYAANIRYSRADLMRFEAGRNLLLRQDGSPPAIGHVLKQADLARTYRAIAEGGIDWFYRGPFAKTVGQWMEKNGGILSTDDLAAYKPLVREPLVTTYRGRTIVGYPPPSSGGVHVAQILNILEHFDLAAIDHRDRGEFIHIVAEAMKLAFADRAHWLGDPAFAKVPRTLAGKEYAAAMAAKINPARATPVSEHGLPPNSESNVFGKHTTHIAATDADGNWVAITQTINTSFGSKVMVPGTGVFLNNEMDDFAILPGQPNYFGLVGSKANAVAPFKRPLSSMSPTIVLADGKPVLTLGAAGGPTIISQVVLGIVRHFDLEMPVEQAVAQKRFHHQWSPDELRVEEGIGGDIAASLASRGHKLKTIPIMGVTQAIRFEAAGKEFLGVADPRVPGKAAGL